MSTPTNKERQTPKQSQQPQQEQQKGPHPSVLLQELHEMVRLQSSQLDAMGSRNDEVLRLQSAMLDDILSSLNDLNSAVQTLLITVKTIRQDDPVEPLVEEVDDPEYDDLAEEESAVDNADAPLEEDDTWDENEEEEEPEPAPQPSRRAAQPAEQTQAYGEGPAPLALPFSPASQLRRRPTQQQRGGRA